MQALRRKCFQAEEEGEEGLSDIMESKLIKEWMGKGLSISKDFDFFAKRDNVVVGKLKEKEAVAEYQCDCGHYEIKNIEMEKSKSGKRKKFLRPKFKCSSCGNTIVVESLKKKK